MIITRIIHAMIGLAIGDAMGLPNEFDKSEEHLKKMQDAFGTKWEDFVATLRTRRGYKKTVPGQVSDDTEMSMALLYGLLEIPDNNTLPVEILIKQYIDWANDRTNDQDEVIYSYPMMGRNTENLFKGYKQIKTYFDRVKRYYPDDNSKINAQSNGALMRSVPLCILNIYTKNDLFLSDSRLTHPGIEGKFTFNDICVGIYVQILTNLVQGNDISQTINILEQNINNFPILKDIYNAAVNKKPIEYSNKYEEISSEVQQVGVPWIDRRFKGWVGSTLYVLFWSMNFIKMGVQPVVVLRNVAFMRGADTDTNAAIVGAVIGAMLGKDLFLSKTLTEFWNIIISADTTQGDYPRPCKYHPKSIPCLTTKVIEKYFPNYEAKEAFRYNLTEVLNSTVNRQIDNTNLISELRNKNISDKDLKSIINGLYPEYTGREDRDFMIDLYKTAFPEEYTRDKIVNQIWKDIKLLPLEQRTLALQNEVIKYKNQVSESNYNLIIAELLKRN